MRNFLLAACVLLSVCASAQVNNSFRGTLNVFSATGLAPNYRVTGFFSDASGYYSSDSCEVGDVIFAFYTTTCVRFVVDSIVSKAGSIIIADIVDVDSVTAAFPLGVTAIMRETATNGYPVNISGISGPLASCIETHFKGLVDIVEGGGSSAPGNSQDTVVQVAHGLTLLDPVHIDTSGVWIVSNVSSDDSLHIAIVTEVIAADTFIVTYSGISTQAGHGYDLGAAYYVQDNGSYDLTAPLGLINDIAFYVVNANKIFVTEQRPVAPMTDLNGIYSTSDTIPNGVGAYATDFKVHTDSTQLRWVGNELVVTDSKATPNGILYADSDYVTDPLSLTTKGYVDAAIAVSAHPAVTVTDGATVDLTLATQNITAEVKPESITSSHIDTSAVGSSEIQDYTIQPVDLDTQSVTSLAIADGTITTTDLAFTVNGGSGATNQVTYWTAANTLAGSSEFQFDGTNAAIGTAPAASNKLIVQGDGTTASTFGFQHQNSSGTGTTYLKDDGSIINRYLGLSPMASTEIATAQLSINKQMTTIYPSTTLYGIDAHIYHNTPSGGNTHSVLVGVRGQAGNRGTTGGYVRNIYGGIFSAYTLQSTQSGVGLFGIDASWYNTSTSIEGAYGVYITGANTGTITNSYGLLIGDITSGTQTNQAYSIYASDASARNAIFGNTGFSIAVPTARVHVFGAGATSSTTGLLVQNSAGNNAGVFRDDLRVALGNNVSPVNAWVTVAPSTTAGASINVPAGTAPTSPQDGDVWTSSTQKSLTSNQAGITQSLVGTIFTGTSTVTVNNTASETTLIPTGIGTVTLPANFWVEGKTIEISAYGDWRTDTVPSTLELRVELGGVLLCTTSAQTMVATEGGQWKATATVTCRSTGATGTTMSEGELRMNSAPGTSLTYEMYRSTVNVIDTTAPAAFDITVTNGTADPFNEMRLHTLTIKALN